MKTLTKNIFSLLLGEVAYRVLGFLIAVYLARVLDQNGFGVINFCMAVLSYAMIASNSGLTVIGTRIVSGKSGELNPLINSIIFLRFLHALGAWVFLTLIFYFIYGRSDIFNIMAVYLIYLLPSAFLIEWFFQGKERMLTISAGRIIGVSAYLIFIIYFVTSKEHIIFAPIGYVAGALINAFFLVMVYIISGNHLRFRLFFRQIKTLWFQSIPISLSSSLTQLVLQLPPVFLAVLSTFESVGIYSVAFRLISIILVFDRLLSFLFFPAVCRWIQYKVDLKDYLKRTVRIVNAMSFLLIIILLLLAKNIIELSFGENYRESTVILQILCGYACLTFINSTFSYTLIALKKENVYLRSLIWGAAGFVLCIIVLSEVVNEAAPAIGLIVFDYISLLIMNKHLKPWISMKASMSVTVLFLITIIVIISLLFLFEYSLFINFIIAFIILIPLIVLLTGIRMSDFRYLKRITI